MFGDFVEEDVEWGEHEACQQRAEPVNRRPDGGEEEYDVTEEPDSVVDATEALELWVFEAQIVPKLELLGAFHALHE